MIIFGDYFRRAANFLFPLPLSVSSPKNCELRFLPLLRTPDLIFFRVHLRYVF